MSKPRIHQIHQIAESRIFRIESIDLEFSNGVKRTYERMVSGGHGAVMIVPFVDDEHFLLVREYAVGMEDYTLTLPGGAIDMGETLEQAAVRELKEEIGYGARQVLPLKPLALNPRYAKSSLNTAIATDLYPEELEGDEPEPLEVIKWNIHNLDELMAHPQMVEGRGIAAIYLAQAWKLAGRF